MTGTDQDKQTATKNPGGGTTLSRTIRQGALRWAWVLVLAGAFALRSSGLGKPLWEDEAVTLEGFRTLAGLRFTDWLMPASDLHRLSAALVTTGSLTMARLPYLMVGLIGVGLGWALGRTWRSWTLAFLMATALALWPFKLFWDTLAREYSLVLALGLAAIVAWERFRLRPGWMRYGVALATTVAAALTHELALVMLLFPPCYLAWAAWGLFKRGGQSWQHAAGVFAGRVALAGLALHVTLALALGGGYWRGLIAQGDATAGSVVVGATSSGFSAFHGASGHLPGLGAALHFVAGNTTSALRPGNWSIAPLLGLGRELPHTNGAYIFNQLTLDPRGIFKIARGGITDSLLLVLLLAGAAGLARRSAPLALALGSVIVANSALVFFNQQLRMPVDRYYALAGLACLILCVHGLFSLGHMTSWGLRSWIPASTRRRARKGILRGVPAVCAVGFGLALLAYASTGRELARYSADDWRTFYERMNDKFPDGVFFNGVRAQAFQVYERLRTNVSAPEHNIIRDAIGFRLERDEQLFDLINRMDGVVIFRPDYMKGQPYMPFKRFAGLFTWNDWNEGGLIAQYAGLGNKVFITRGGNGESIQLKPRMRPNQEQPGNYVLALYHEVPGTYALRVKEDVGFQFKSGTWDGVALPLKEEPRAKPTDPAIWETQIVVEGDPMQAHQLALQFDNGRSEVVWGPSLEWSHLENPPWSKLTEGLSYAPLRITRDGTDFVMQTELRVEQGMPLLTRCAARLISLAEKKIMLRWEDIVIDAPRRDLSAGDLLWSGPLRISEAQARGWIGKELAIELIPVVLNAAINDPRFKALGEGKLDQGAAAGLVKALPGKRIQRLRFAEMRGGVVLQTAD